ncbi:cation/multidrug efflux pump [Bernardetia litoralis DSM 6794]|uniref:Cation/multidrug efflux pump n=1 Tax=Bernardetia litoralis (strain ATCC 23117 / DSM 6794 / NBRC 15988 / NCIMB 1366 / Fx l1 / Sio-4) TaxID=880071 RepID=I4AMV5_BERLS|nr:efflux RND transporter permease subunit [Bernardetia litoralis]AFM05290.1 cation/multidrug efflux pump [Bernardetia litoralis DSM 6794]
MKTNQNPFLHFLFSRPVGVLMAMLGILVLSLVAFSKLPVSLLPSLDVPELVIQLDYRGHSPEEIEQTILRPIRENVLTLNGLKRTESEARSQIGQVRLYFEFGTDMTLAYIDANEKLDRLLGSLPKELPRPRIIKINTADIPILHLQIVPKKQENQNNLLATSELVEKVIKKQLEAVEGISLVDANGLKEKQISISTNLRKLQSLGLSETDLITTIKSANQTLSSISVKEGQYRYFVKIATILEDKKDLENLPIRLNINSDATKNKQKGTVVLLKDIAKIELEEPTPQGFHLFNQKEAFVLTLHKQSQAQIQELTPKIDQTLEDLKQNFPELEFITTQNQTTLLNLAIDNLKNSLLIGGICVFLVLFIFMGNWRVPLIIGISLPVSLIYGFGLFYVFDVSINVISLSGMALGLGMLIDNSIIVLENIEQFRNRNFEMKEAAILGVQEVIAPLVSSVLTTLSVFVPLIFLNGLSGALFYDQAISAGAVLFTSLVVAFLMLPHLYLILNRKKSSMTTLDLLRGEKNKETKIYKFLLSLYQKIFLFLENHKKIFLSFSLFLIILPVFLFYQLDIEGAPKINKTDCSLLINWNEPIDATENKIRCKRLLETFSNQITFSESDIGQKKYFLQNDNSTQIQANLYLFFDNQNQKETTQNQIAEWIFKTYPATIFDFLPAPDAFSQLFISEEPSIELRIRTTTQNQILEYAIFDSIYNQINFETNNTAQKGKGTSRETLVLLEINTEKAALYGFSQQDILQKLTYELGEFAVTDLTSFGQIVPIRFKKGNKTVEEIINESSLKVNNVESNTDFAENSSQTINQIPLRLFIDFKKSNSYNTLTADELGIYQSVFWEDINNIQPTKQQQIKNDILTYLPNIQTNFKGTYFSNQENLTQFIFILSISIGLLYFILVAQFESFWQPLLVLFTLPLGISGSLLLLIFSQTSLNTMAIIGIIVMLGIMVNDAILKIDTINKLKKEMSLYDAVHEAGKLRLKPILMTSITTILAVIPILFSEGLGADLQKPLVWAVVGGLSVGTITALFFIPMAYFEIAKYQKNE